MTDLPRRLDRVQDALGGHDGKPVDTANRCLLYKGMELLDTEMREEGLHSDGETSPSYYRFTSARANRYGVLQRGGEPVLDVEEAIVIVEAIEEACIENDADKVRRLIRW